MARKNISIGTDTWEDLAKLGRFGQTFDDVIKVLLRNNEELKKLKSQLASHQPPQQQRADLVRDGVDAMAGQSELEQSKQEKLKTYPFKGSITLSLPGLTFPTTKNKIIECAKSIYAKDTNTRPIINALNSLPDKEYKNDVDLGNTLASVYNKMLSAYDDIKNVEIKNVQIAVDDIAEVEQVRQEEKQSEQPRPELSEQTK